MKGSSMIIKKKTANHKEWLALRNGYIGGSDAAAVIGLNPYKSPFALWAEKTGQTLPFRGNIATRVGNELEQLVATLYAEETGNKVRNDNGTYFNDAYPWACANIDRRIIGAKAGLEIKTTGDWNKIKALKAGEIPNDWLCQMTHYMAVTGYERWDLAALAEGRELYILTLNREEEDIRALMQAEQEFWRCVQSREPPGVDGSKATAEALSQLYQNEDTGTCVLLDPVAHDLEHLLQLKAEKKELEVRIKEAENVVKAYMGTSESGAYGNVSVTWKTVTQTTYDTKALRREHPDLARQYKRISTSRRFTIKED